MTNITKEINIKNICTSNSGLYMESFFAKHYLDPNELQDNFYKMEYNVELFNKYHLSDDEDEEYSSGLFGEALSLYLMYFSPLIFDEEIAYKCVLVPFVYCKEIEDIDLLALAGFGMNLTPRLDAYQSLVNNTIDKQSLLFSDKAYFAGVVGESVTKQVIEAISINK